MEQYVLKLLKTISLHDTSLLNGAIFTCKDDYTDFTPCMTCISCKLMIVLKFSVTLLNHMTDQDIVKFILDCIGFNETTDIVSALDCLLCPLDGKDRIYSTSRARPSLSTDLIDFSLKNHTVNRVHLSKTTNAISEWIVAQPQILKSQFIVSILSGLKLAVLAEVYRSIDRGGKLKIQKGVSLIDLERTPAGDSNVISSDPSANVCVEVKATTNNQMIQDPCIDLISLLPVHISKYILNLLDETSLKVCSGISDNWKAIVSQVRREDVVTQKIKEQSKLLQEVSTKAMDPCYAKDADVPVPRLKPGTNEVVYKEGCEDVRKHKPHRQLSLDNSVDESFIPISREVFNMKIGYKDISTKNVIMEERNVYCGSYSVLLVMEGIPKQATQATRTIAYNSGELIAVSGSNKLIQFVDIEGRTSNMTKKKIHGHSGSVKVLRMIRKPGRSVYSGDPGYRTRNDSQVLSGSYDTTIRRWDIDTGKCLKIYIGHTLTVTSLDVADTSFVSGSMDGTCKLWNYEEGTSVFTMRHKHAVTAVAMSLKLIVSGDSSGIVKVWNMDNGDFIKNLCGHSLEISAVRVDNFHIMSASLDCYVLLWSSMGFFNTCVGCYRHPKPVLCMELTYMRAVTGSVDGRIRVWNLLTGQCIRIIHGNSRSDPILNMVVNDNRIVINTVSNILVLNFEKIIWVYESKNHLEYDTDSRGHAVHAKAEKRPSPYKHSLQRYERARFAGNIDPRLFLSPVSVKNETNSGDVKKLSTKETSCRQFEDGMKLTRASAWLVTPSLTRSIRLVDKPTEAHSKIPANELVTENKEVLNKTEEENRLTSNSTLERRISYGFERSDHVKSTVELQDVKNTLRKHIRSGPITAAQAMPDFVKAMVIQMRESASSGRPLSAFSSHPLTRRSSGPSEYDLRAKSTSEDIKLSLNPTVNLNPATGQDQPIKNKPPIKFKLKTTFNENLPGSNIISSAKYFSNRSVVTNFFVPKNYKENLLEKKSEFDRRHNASVGQAESGEKLKNICATPSPGPSLNLKTFEGCQEYLRQVNQIQVDYDRTKLLSKESEKYEKWLMKVSGLPCPTYEKDAVRKRPRSAKI